MNKTVWKESSGALRRILGSVDMPGDNYALRARSHLEVLYKFGRYFNTRTRIHHIFNLMTNNVIATVKVRDGREGREPVVVIRYRRGSVYEDILKNYNYPIKTVHVASRHLGLHSNRIREAMRPRLQRELNRWREERQRRLELAQNGLEGHELIRVPYREDISEGIDLVRQMAVERGYTDMHYVQRLQEFYINEAGRPGFDYRTGFVNIWLDMRRSDEAQEAEREQTRGAQLRVNQEMMERMQQLNFEPGSMWANGAMAYTSFDPSRMEWVDQSENIPPRVSMSLNEMRELSREEIMQYERYTQEYAEGQAVSASEYLIPPEGVTERNDSA